MAPFLALVGLSRISIVQQGINFSVSPYPPSFDNNPILFGWALNARMLIVMMCSATLVRVVSRTRLQRLPANHPIVYTRVTWCSFMCASGLGGLSDTLTYLFWGELSPGSTQTVLALARLFDALSILPFMCGLFAPFVINTLIRAGVLQGAGTMTLNGLVHDIRSTWDTPQVPLRLLVICASTSLLLTVAKYGLWLGHGHP